MKFTVVAMIAVAFYVASAVESSEETREKQTGNFYKSLIFRGRRPN